VKLDEAVEGQLRLVVFLVLVGGIGGHQFARTGPRRIGMLALDLVEGLAASAYFPMVIASDALL